ncbi:MAG: Mur ligase domain-containing protein [Opitutales bacterium]|nr:Mur ligase domain-containing protein [Opitutales bacterium]
MRGISTEELVTITDGKWHGGMPEQQIERFCFDARQVQLGECFVALSGGARDGHDFVQQAQVGGAVMALVERPVDVNIPQLVVTDSLRSFEVRFAGGRDHR